MDSLRLMTCSTAEVRAQNFRQPNKRSSMVDQMRSPKEQIYGLMKLAELVGKSECNTFIQRPLGDVAFLIAADTPDASQIVYASGGYDVWVWKGENMTIQSTDLSIEDAAKVVVAEYHLAKAARIKTMRPDLDIKDIMNTLTEGYQKRR